MINLAEFCQIIVEIERPFTNVLCTCLSHQTKDIGIIGNDFKAAARGFPIKHLRLSDLTTI